MVVMARLKFMGTGDMRQNFEQNSRPDGVLNAKTGERPEKSVPGQCVTKRNGRVEKG